MRRITATHAAPHLHAGPSAAGIIWTVVVCLLPSGMWGVWSYGLRALLVIAVSVGSAVAAEVIANLLSHRFTLRDGSAVLSGLLIAYMLPSGVPLYVPIGASLFAMLVIKASFGGLGSNWMNPAVGGQVFAYFSWAAALSAWGLPRLWPSGVAGENHAVVSPLQFISHRGTTLLASYPVTTFGRQVGDWLHHTLRMTVDPHYVDLVIGSVPGDIGAVSAPLLILGSIYLFYKRIATWHTPVAFLAAFLVLVWVFGGLPQGRGWFAGAPALQLLSGGTLLAALFLCTDPTTSPLTGRGMVIFGIGVGVLAFLIRIFGVAEEAVFMAILLMNLLVPAIDRLSERWAHAIAR